MSRKREEERASKREMGETERAMSRRQMVALNCPLPKTTHKDFFFACGLTDSSEKKWQRGGVDGAELCRPARGATREVGGVWWGSESPTKQAEALFVATKEVRETLIYTRGS